MPDSTLINQDQETYRMPRGGYWTGQIFMILLILVFGGAIVFSLTIKDDSMHETRIVFAVLMAIAAGIEWFILDKLRLRVVVDFVGISTGSHSMRWGEIQQMKDYYSKNTLTLTADSGSRKIVISRGIERYAQLKQSILERCGKFLKDPEFPLHLSVPWTSFYRISGIALAIFSMVCAGDWRHEEDLANFIIFAVVLGSFYTIPFLFYKVFSIHAGLSELVLRKAFQKAPLRPEDIELVTLRFKNYRGILTYYMNIRTKAGKNFRLFEDLASMSELESILKKFLGSEAEGKIRMYPPLKDGYLGL